MYDDRMHVNDTVVRLRDFHYSHGIATCIHVHVYSGLYITVLSTCNWKLGPNQLTNKNNEKGHIFLGGI